MTTLKIILMSVIILIGLFLIIGFFLPKKIRLSESIVIAAPAPLVYQNVVDLKAFSEWSPWAAQDPSIVTSFNDIPSGVGAEMSWTSRKSGEGRMTIVEAVENKSMKIELDFGKMGVATSGWEFTEEAGKTKAQWSMASDMGGGPINGWINLMVKVFTSKAYKDGLKMLKTRVEGQV